MKIMIFIVLFTIISSNANTNRLQKCDYKHSRPLVKEIIKKVYVKVPVRVYIPAHELSSSPSNVNKIQRQSKSSSNARQRRDGSKHMSNPYQDYANHFNKSRALTKHEEKIFQNLSKRIQTQGLDALSMSINDPLKNALIVFDSDQSTKRTNSAKKKKRPARTENVEYDDEEDEPTVSPEDEAEEDDLGDEEFSKYLQNKKNKNKKKWQSRYNTYQQLENQKKRQKKPQNDKVKHNKFEEKLIKFILENTNLISSIVSRQNLARCMLQCASSLVHAGVDTSTPVDTQQLVPSEQSLIDAAFQSMNIPDDPLSAYSYFGQQSTSPLYKNLQLPAQPASPVTPTSSYSSNTPVQTSPPPSPLPKPQESMYVTVQRTVKPAVPGQIISQNSETYSTLNFPNIVSGSSGTGVDPQNGSNKTPSTTKSFYFVLGNEKPKDIVEQLLSGPYPSVDDPHIDFDTGVESNRDSVVVTPTSTPPAPSSVVARNIYPMQIIPKQTVQMQEALLNFPTMYSASNPPMRASSPQNSWPFSSTNSLANIASPPLSSFSRSPYIQSTEIQHPMGGHSLQTLPESTSKRIRAQMRKLFDVNNLAILPRAPFGRERL